MNFMDDAGLDPAVKTEALTKATMSDTGLDSLQKAKPALSPYGNVIDPSPWKRGTKVVTSPGRPEGGHPLRGYQGRPLHRGGMGS